MSNTSKEPAVINLLRVEIPANIFALKFQFIKDKEVFEDYWDAEGLEAFKAWVAKREQEGC